MLAHRAKRLFRELLASPAKERGRMPCEQRSRDVASATVRTEIKIRTWQNQLSENEVELIFKASIDEHWHLYSQDIADDGPVPTSFTFIIDGDTSVKVLEEPNAIEEYDPNFEMVLKYFADVIAVERLLG